MSRLTVDPHSSRLQVVGDANGGVEVVGVEGGGKTVGVVVSELDDLLLVLELGNGTDGAENLLLHDLHVGSDVAEDSRLDEVALVTVPATASLELGTVLLSILNVTHNPVVLQLTDLRALERLLVERVADGVGSRPLLEGLEERVVDILMHVDTRAGATALAMVVVDTEVDPRNGLLDVGVLEDNVWRLATKLEGNFLQVRVGSGLHDLATDAGGASKGDLVDVHMR